YNAYGYILAAVQCGCCVGYLVYINRHVNKPFQKLERFAENVAGGNLDIPLEMDRQNLFGAFTESFDIMRSELKKARLAEARANASKKELTAQLSHDIRTPVSSILAASEVGAATTDNEKDRQNYTHIMHKADQIGTLVTNLFSATLEELQQLAVEPADMESGALAGMLLDADYFHYSKLPPVPDCLIFADKVRLQQVFDNLFSNSYKYANTKIDVAIAVTEAYLTVRIEDHGGGVSAEELPRLKEKYRRGSNSNKMEGAGLGLYISDCFMKEMQGELVIENGADGFAATVRIPLSGSVRFKESLRNA
ncbi:MAG: HAMP domain-containing histidine kinase, partial [Lachnospiraceae bacterium]|nr:HAMP domain-containing histidine kinase [Lachnospiraceae bacterium]